MNEYECQWITDVPADSPLDAARLAESVVCDRPSGGRHWVVIDRSTGQRWDINLEQEGS